MGFLQKIGQHSLLWEQEWGPEGMVPLILLRRHTLQWIRAGQVDSVLVDRQGQTGQ